MKLIRQLITIALEKEEFFKSQLDREKAYYWHVSAYLHSLAYLKEFDPDVDLKKSLWYKVLNSTDLTTRRKYFDILQKFKQKEDKIIIKALYKIDEDIRNNKFLGMGSLYQHGTVGVLEFEFEAVS